VGEAQVSHRRPCWHFVPAGVQGILEPRSVRRSGGHENMGPTACCIEHACQRHEALIGCVILGSNLRFHAFGLQNHEAFDS
jgi:hypothetical protein